MFESKSVAELLPLMQEVFAAGGQFRLYPRGTSMLPLLRAGVDSVLLASPPARIAIGDMLLFREENGAFLLHRVIRQKEGLLTLCGDNRVACEEGIPTAAVVARVTAIYRGEKRLAVDSLRLRLYARTCMATRPLRRLYASLRALLRKKKKTGSK